MWERNTNLLFSHVHPDWRSNPQPGYVPWPGIEPATFLIYGMTLQQTQPHWPGKSHFLWWVIKVKSHFSTLKWLNRWPTGCCTFKVIDKLKSLSSTNTYFYLFPATSDSYCGLGCDAICNLKASKPLSECFFCLHFTYLLLVFSKSIS